jgi:hypothetical protein
MQSDYLTERRLREALERAFLTFGRFGGNHVSELHAQTVRSSEIRAAWLDAREALQGCPNCGGTGYRFEANGEKLACDLCDQTQPRGET